MDDTLQSALTAGLVALAIAVFAWWRDHRRRNRSDPDAVGLLPWLTIYFFASFIAILALGLAGVLWLRG